MTSSNNHTKYLASSNLTERVISIYRKTMKTTFKSFLFCQSISTCSLSEALICQHSNIKSEIRSFKSNENIHKKEGGSYYVVSGNKASSVTL